MNNFVALLMGPDLKFHMKMPNIRFDMGFIRLITNDYYTIGTSFKWFSLKAYAYNLEWRELFDSKVAAVDYVFRLKFFFATCGGLRMFCVFFFENNIFNTKRYYQFSEMYSFFRRVLFVHFIFISSLFDQYH